METSWWLNWSALPDRLIWARLQVAEDGSAVVLDMDGKYHRFPNRREAGFWLNEDEYSQFAHLVEDGEVGSDVSPPSAASDRELVPLMCVQQRQAEPSAAADPRRIGCFRPEAPLAAGAAELGRSAAEGGVWCMAGWYGNFPQLDTWEQLERVLRDEVVYCGCDHAGPAIEVLRDVLRGARDWKDGLVSQPQDDGRMSSGRTAMLGRLGYEANPGLAVWFLYWLDHRGLVEHYSVASVSAITDKGRWLLDGIERLYPPPARGEDAEAEPDAAADGGGR